MNNILISSYSFNISNSSDITSIENSINHIINFIDSVPTYNDISVTKDILQFRMGEETLDDILFEVSGMQSDIYQHYLNEFEKSISSNKSNITTEEVLETVNEGPSFRGDFASVYYQVGHWPNIPATIHVSNQSSVYELNCQNLELHPISNDDFSERAELLFNNVIFHPDFSETLTTVKTGAFEDYSIEFVRATRALHNAVPLLTNSGHNPPDLITIRDETAKLGRTMGCTPQGKNKDGLYYDFKIFHDEIGKDKEINMSCEYHLKINFDNTGEKINSDFYNRAYFGLPLIEGRKRITLAFMGKHYNED
ncbi:MAG: hypothetical protein RPR97_12040 [Colwellia sp.]